MYLSALSLIALSSINPSHAATIEGSDLHCGGGRHECRVEDNPNVVTCSGSGKGVVTGGSHDFGQPIKHMACGYDLTWFILQDLTVHSIGIDGNGQRGNGSPLQAGSTPEQVVSDFDGDSSDDPTPLYLVDVECGATHCLGTHVSGKLVGAGETTDWRLGVNPATDAKWVIEIPKTSGVGSVNSCESVSPMGAMGINATENTAIIWGHGAGDGMTTGNSPKTGLGFRDPLLAYYPADDERQGFTGPLYDMDYTLPLAGNYTPHAHEFKDVDGGRFHYLMVADAHYSDVDQYGNPITVSHYDALIGGGDGWNGELGVDLSTLPAHYDGSSLRLIDNSRTWVRVAAGNGFSCALDDTGDVWCTGTDSKGQMGQGSGDQSTTTLTKVPGLSDVLGIDAWASKVCAYKADSHVCWGNNDQSPTVKASW